MDCVLTRLDYTANGVYGTLDGAAHDGLGVTLEHSYGAPAQPKIPLGTYTCVRGEHKLHGMANTFTTFEVTGVEGHENILFHWGNYNKDSEGCILLGEKREGPMVINSKKTFAKFMALQEGANTFTLTVNDVATEG